MNLRETILAKDDIPREQVVVPEWGVTVEVRGMDGQGRSDWMESAFNAETGTFNFAGSYPALIIQTCYDPETGERVFEAADRDALNAKAASATERLGKVAMRLCGMGEESVEAGKDDSPLAVSAASSSS